jgi:hypothetical protein
MESGKDEVIAANREAAAVVAQWLIDRSRQQRSSTGILPRRLRDRGMSITNPAGFWTVALQSTDSNPREIEQGLKLAAAKLQAGDIGFVIESGLGQVAWLSALALELRGDADELPVDSAARARLLALSLRAEGSAAKLMLSLGALLRLKDTSGVLIEAEQDPDETGGHNA